MSHIAQYQSVLVNPNMKLLEKTFRILATRHNGTVGKKIRGFFQGQEQKTLLSIRTPEFKRGLGVIRNGQGIEFICDPYGHEQIVEQLQSEITATYQVVALRQVLKSQGYAVSVQDDRGGGYIIDGVMAA